MLIFVDGNEYGAEAAFRRMLVPARALGLDLIAFNYYDQGQPRLSMAEMRSIGDELVDSAATLPTAGDTLRIDTPDGRSNDVEFKTGDIRYREPVTHTTENIGKTRRWLRRGGWRSEMM